MKLLKLPIIILCLAGIIFLLVRVITETLELNVNYTLVLSLISLLIGVLVLLIAIIKTRQNRKIDNIIKSYKSSNKTKLISSKKGSSPKGWGMNNSPFRDRKSGATWGGGNIKAASANRGNRKSFLK